MTNGGETSEPSPAPTGWDRRPVFIAAAAQLALLALAFRPFFGGLHSPFTSDIRHYHHPVTRMWEAAISQGRLPLWTDHTFLGFPAIADPQLALFYPGTPLVAALGPHTGYVVFLVLHAWIGALGTLGWLRSVGVSWTAAFAGGLLLPLGGYFAHELQHPGLYAILCWMPAWFWATREMFRRPRPLAFAGIALVVAAMLFAGTLQVLFGVLLLYGFYWLGSWWQHSVEVREDTDVSEAPVQSAARAAVWVFLANVLGLGIAAIVLLPAIEHLPRTARALGMTYEFAAMGSVHPWDLLGMTIRDAGRWLESAPRSEFAEVSFFLGSLTLPLAIVGGLAVRRRTAVALWVALALLVWISLGQFGGLHRALYDAAPGWVGSLRGMSRALGPVSLVIAVFAAWGLDRVGWPDARHRTQLSIALVGVLVLQLIVFGAAGDSIGFDALASVGVVLAAIALLAGVRVGWFAASGAGLRLALATLLVLELVSVGPLPAVLAQNPPPPANRSVPDQVSELVTAVRAEAGNSLDSRTRLLLQGFGPLNLPLVNGVDGVGGYNPLVTLQYLDFVSLVNQGKLFPRTPLDRFVSGARPQRFDAPLFDAASVGVVFSNLPERTRGLEMTQRYGAGVLADHGAVRYSNPDALPRAYLTYRTLRASDRDDLVRRLGRGFDPRRVSIVEGAGPLLEGPAEIRAVEREGPRPEHRRFRVDTERPAVLVVTDSFHPGWRAWVDGREAPIFRVNAMFRGVALSAGAQQVEMRFAPASFRTGAVISSISLFLLLGVIGWAIRSRRVASGASDPSAPVMNRPSKRR